MSDENKQAAPKSIPPAVIERHLFGMNVLDTWSISDKDLIIRVPKGWIFTVGGQPVLVPEPSNYVFKNMPEEVVVNDDMDDVIKVVEEMEYEDSLRGDGSTTNTKDDGVYSESVQCTGAGTDEAANTEVVGREISCSDACSGCSAAKVL